MLILDNDRSVVSVSHTSLMARAVARTGATGAIAPVDFRKEAQIAPVVQNLIVELAPVD